MESYQAGKSLAVIKSHATEHTCADYTVSMAWYLTLILTERFTSGLNLTELNTTPVFNNDVDLFIVHKISC